MYWIKDLTTFLEIADTAETPLKFFEVSDEEVKVVCLARRNLGHKAIVTDKTLLKLKEHGFVEAEYEQSQGRWDW